MQYWLFKSEPDAFSIDDLAAATGKTSCWDGVRNYQVRNYMRDQMQVGDQAFFYHSSCAIPGIVGTMTITKTGYTDHTQFDAKHHHYDPDSKRDAPRWLMVDVKLQRKFKRIITLDELRQHAGKQLSELLILKRGNRLSVTPVTKQEWQYIVGLE
ncbi:MAG: EVE domain-containing protein [Steroidobacteraceae bacterium]